MCVCVCFFFFQAEDGIRDLVRSRGLGDVYKRQFHLVQRHGLARVELELEQPAQGDVALALVVDELGVFLVGCLLYTSDAADERSSVDLGGRRIIKKK